LPIGKVASRAIVRGAEFGGPSGNVISCTESKRPADTLHSEDVYSQNEFFLTEESSHV